MRAYHELGAPGDYHPEAEAFAGLYIVFPTVGAGLRWQYAPLHGDRDALTLRPGIDCYLMENPFLDTSGWLNGHRHFFAMPAADVDIIWQHQLDRRWGGELGLKLGCGVAFTSHPTPWPIAGVFLGFRY
jgi:hypothetical protein